MSDRADTGVPHVHSSVVRLGVGNEFVEVVGWEAFIRGDRKRVYAHDADRGEIGIRVVRKIGLEHGRGGMGSHMPDLNGVAIGSGAHRTGRSGCAAGPCDILNDE